MKKHTQILTGLALVLFCFTANAQTAKTDEKKATTDQKAQAEADAMMKAWTTYMTPGEMHKLLAADVGSWTEDITTWMAPGATPSKSTATCENEMIMDGRYQKSVHRGDFQGTPFEGMGLVGYDNAKKVFQSTWVDNMGTGTMLLEGPYDAAKKTIHFKGNMVDPTTGKETGVRQDWIIGDNNTRTLKMFITGPDGKEFQTMEIHVHK
ncbi:MAG: DUF1579 domain-containing protein [Bacteroidia bacterium]|nr:DUF1579 domain-containing protein [Bacteroidia bacterium]